MTHQQTNTTMHSMLRALENNISNARAKRLGTDVEPMSEPTLGLCGINSEQESTPMPAGRQETYPDGTPRLKAKRKVSSSFTTPMPTRSVWDRRAG
jgi:hypothetical protein